MIHVVKKRGFTIVELMLSMTFISALLLAIATMTMRMTSMYVKGNTMKDLNAASRTINDDFTRTFNSMATTPTWQGSYTSVKSGEYSVLWLWSFKIAYRITSVKNCSNTAIPNISSIHEGTPYSG